MTRQRESKTACVLGIVVVSAVTLAAGPRPRVCQIYGDANGDGSVELDDVLCLLDGFSGIFGECSFDDVDLAPCGGNSVVDLDDILAGVDVLAGEPLCPDVCPDPGIEPGTWDAPANSFGERPLAADVHAMRNVLGFSGEFVETAVDVRIRSRGFNFVWARKYRSRHGQNTALGNGWNHSYDIRLESSGNDLVLFDGNGRSDLYVDQGDGSFHASDYARTLSQNGDATYTLTLAHKDTWNFHSLGTTLTAGKIASIVDRHSNTMGFAYDAAGRLTTVTDTLTRPITISYDTNGMISAVTDFAGRAVTYSYHDGLGPGGGAGDLATVTSPVVVGTPTDNDYPGGKTTTYTYSKEFADERLNHNLLTITDAKGQTFLINEYDTTLDPSAVNFDRVMRQTWGDSGDVIDSTYVPVIPSAENNAAVLMTVANDRVGNVAESYYDARNRLVVIRQYTGRADPDTPTTATANRPTNKLRVGDPDFFETRYGYDEDGLITLIVQPNGNQELFIYAPLGSDRRKIRNLTERRRLPGSLGGDQREIVHTFEYESDFNFVTRYVDPCTNETQHSYDALGNRAHTRHRIPTVIEDFEYNAFGQLTAHVWPDNGSGHRRRDEFSYYIDAPQRGYLREQVIDAGNLAQTTTYDYDAVGNVIREIDPRNNDTLHDYNALDQVVRTRLRPVSFLTGPLRYEQLFYYDANDNLARSCVLRANDQGVVDPSDQYITATHEFDTLNMVTRTCQETGVYNVPQTPPQLDCSGLPQSEFLYEEYTYDASRNPTLVRLGEAVDGAQPNNHVRALYDERDLPFQVILGDGDASATTDQFDYDANGNLASHHQGLQDAPRLVARTYDGYDRLLVMTDPLGNVTRYHYDATDNRTSLQVEGELVDVAGSAGNIVLTETNYEYDDMGRITLEGRSSFDPLTQAPIGDGESTTQYAYSDNSQLRVMTDDNGHALTTTYDTANRVSLLTDASGNEVNYLYDANGNVLNVFETEKSDQGNPDETYVTTMAYDAVDRLTVVVDNVGNTSTFRYDSRDNHTAQSDALANIVRYTYDAYDRLLSVAHEMTDSGDGGGTVLSVLTTSQQWDDSSRLISRTDPNGNVTTYQYDVVDRLTDVGLADCTNHTFQYDAQGNLTSAIDANGTARALEYDDNNRLTTVTYFPATGVSTDLTTESYTYDGRNRIVQADDDDSTVDMGYDSLGRITREALNGHATTSTYDGVGNRLTCAYPSGRTIGYAYEVLDRITTINEGGAGGPLIASYQFVGPGDRMEQMDYGNSSQTTYGYDGIANAPGDWGVKQMISTHHVGGVAGPTVLDSRTYVWDPMYNKTRRKDERPSGPQLTYNYGYDSAYRMNKGELVDNLGSQVRNTQYIMDAAGNRQQVLDHPQAGTYSMDTLSCEPADSQMNQYTTTPVDSRQYDANGNVTSVSSGPPLFRLLEFDARNQLVQHMDQSGGVVTTFAYDAFGRRFRKTLDVPTALTITTLYYYGTGRTGHCNGWQVVEERDDLDTVQATYVYGGHVDDVLQMVRAGMTYSYHHDDRGNVMAVSDAFATVVERYEYDDFGAPSFFDSTGAPLPFGSNIGNPYQFTGRHYDIETGLYYYRNRYFDPLAGRFLSRDPLGVWGDPGNVGNASAYVGNNPWTLDDPFGLARSSKPKEIVVVGSKVKEVIREAGLRSDGELVQATAAGGVHHDDFELTTGPSVAKKKSREVVVVGSKVKDVVRSAGIVSDKVHEILEAAIGGGALPQTREHILLARQIGVPHSTCGGMTQIDPPSLQLDAGPSQETVDSVGDELQGIVVLCNSPVPHQGHASRGKRKQSLYFPESMHHSGDRYGRIKLRFPWDRSGDSDDDGLSDLAEPNPPASSGDGDDDNDSVVDWPDLSAAQHGHLDYLKNTGDPSVRKLPGRMIIGAPATHARNGRKTVRGHDFIIMMHGGSPGGHPGGAGGGGRMSLDYPTSSGGGATVRKSNMRGTVRPYDL